MKNKVLLNISISFAVLLVFVALVFIVLYKYNIQSLPIGLFLISFIFIIFAVYFIYIRAVGGPIDIILDGISSLVKGNNFVDIDVKTNNEFGTIASFINQIVAKLRDLSGEIKKGKKVFGEIDAVSEIQKNILSTNLTSGINGIDLIIKSKASLQIGGDIFDIIHNKNNAYFYLGSASGEGITRSLIMVMTTTAIRAFALNLLPVAILNKTNDILFEKVKTNHFVSLTFFRWDTDNQKMFYTGAGYQPFLLFSERIGKVEIIKTGGVAMKMMEDTNDLYSEQEINFNTGDVILAFSNGVLETKNKMGDKYSLSRIISILEKNGIDTAKNICTAFTKDFADFIGGQVQENDVSMVLIKNIGQSGNSQNIEVGLSKDSGFVSGEWNWIG